MGRARESGSLSVWQHARLGWETDLTFTAFVFLALLIVLPYTKEKNMGNTLDFFFNEIKIKSLPGVHI